MMLQEVKSHCVGVTRVTDGGIYWSFTDNDWNGEYYNATADDDNANNVALHKAIYQVVIDGNVIGYSDIEEFNYDNEYITENIIMYACGEEKIPYYDFATETQQNKINAIYGEFERYWEALPCGEAMTKEQDKEVDDYAEKLAEQIVDILTEVEE